MEIYKNNTNSKFIKLNYFIKLPTVISAKLLYTITFIPLLFVFSNINMANAIISTTSSKTIQGNSPEFFITDSVKNKLGFTYNRIDYSESIGNIQSDSILYFDKPMINLNDFKMKTFFTERQTINDSTGEYYDVDGDGFADIPVTQELTFIWRDNNQTQIDANDYQNVGCHNNKYAMPLTLEIISNNIQVHTKYGHPNTSDPVQPIIKTYQLAFVGICYAKPNSLIVDPTTQWRAVKADKTGLSGWNPTGVNINGASQTEPVTFYGGGYRKEYVPYHGFKFLPGNNTDGHFPHTGFDGAQFQVVMSGSQEDYNYSISYNSGKYTVDQNGMITFVDKSEPEDEIIMTATLKSDPNYTFKYNFKIAKWLYPMKIFDDESFNFTIEEMKQLCINDNKMLATFRDLSGATTYLEYNVMVRGFGPVMNEWGRLAQPGQKTSDTYPKSKWGHAWYYNRDYYIKYKETGKVEPIIVSSYDGMVSIPSLWNGFSNKSFICQAVRE